MLIFFSLKFIFVLLFKVYSFNTWCLVKGHKHLNKHSAAGLFKYEQRFRGHQVLKD